MSNTMGSIPHLSILKGPSRFGKAKYLHRIFEEVSKDNSDKTALIFEDAEDIRKTSYGALNEAANKVARKIIQTVNEKSLAKNSDGDYIVAVCLPPSDKLLTILLGIWKAGAAYLPLDPTFPSTRIEHILTESKPVLVIYENYKESFKSTEPLTLLEIEENFESANGNNLSEIEPLRHVRDDLAIVMYTSGSTGVPKGVRLPHNVILNRLQWQFRTFPYSKTETTGIFKTALTFVDSIAEIFGPLINGLQILIVPKSVTVDPQKLITLLDNYKIERLVLVPSLLRSLLMYLKLQPQKDHLKNLKLWVCSGEILTASLAKEFYEYFSENEHVLCNFYGSTEIMADVSYHVIKSNKQLQHEVKVPIGVPIDNTILYLLDKDYRPVKSGDIGELFVSGLNLAAGYVNGRDPEKFINNPLAIDPIFSRLFRTGDFARVEKGVLQYEGRTDSQIKIRGHRVDLTEVEKAVSAIEGIDKCVVLCYKPGEANQNLLAFVTTTTNLAENQIETMLRQQLSSYMVPQVILIDSVPLLVNGKTDRQALIRSYETDNIGDSEEYNIDYASVPENQMKEAKILFHTIESVLGRSARSTINVNANFYDIGGNSLNSIVTITSLQQKGYHISIGDFIAAMDLGEILDRMKHTSQNIELKTQPPLYKSEPLNDKYRNEVLDMLTTSFYQKADLEQWLMPNISETDYSELLDKIWDPLVEKGLSFVAISEESNKPIGVALNFDAHDEPEVEITSNLVIIFEFLESIEGPVRDNMLPVGKGEVLHSFMMGTHSTLSAKENVAIMQFMEDEVLKLAKQKQFTGILTTNTNPLTQQLGSSVYGYKTMADCQVNMYTASDNTKPFRMASDSQRAIVHWKEI